MKLDIYRELRAEQARPGMVVLAHGATQMARPIDITGVHIKLGNMIELVGPAVGGPPDDELKLRVRDTETLRIAPTVEQVLGVWSGLCGAVKAAAADYVERQELDNDEPGAAAPWEVVGNMGQLLVTDRHMAFRIDPDLPIPEPAEPHGDDDPE